MHSDTADMREVFDLGEYEPDESEPLALGDPQVILAREELIRFFGRHSERVFYTKQVEVLFEDRYFHWVTNRAIHTLIDDGYIRTEPAALSTGVRIKLLWRKTFRYYKRAGARVAELVNGYSVPEFTHLLGYTGELLTQEALARGQFKWLAHNVRE
jgi:hypothetical protein